MERKKPKKVNDREEWKKLGLVDKWSQSYTGGYVDPNVAKISEIGFVFYFWFGAVINVVCFLCYVIPEYLSDHSTTYRATFTLLILFVHVHLVLHWFLTRRHQSRLTETDHRPVAESHDGVQNSEHRVDIGEKMPPVECVWKYCEICKLRQPPRTHHCKVCDVCTLKRDHHCFMTGVCIGFSNQRHFILLSFYVGVASVLGLSYSYAYLTSNLGPDCASNWDYVLPYIIYRWFMGEIFLQHLLFSFLLHNFFSPFLAFGFFATQVFVTAQGKTLHEVKKGHKVQSGGSLRSNIRSVFGDYWALNFLFPVHVWFKQRGDGINWTTGGKGS